MSRTIAAALTALSITAPAAVAEEVVGRWCDLGWPGGADLVITRSNNEYARTLSFADGSQHRTKLTRRGTDYFAVGSRFGDGYRVTETGTLALFDREGFIRSARSGRCER